MERFVRFSAPTGKIDFLFKLAIFMLICGVLNHLRHYIVHGFPGHDPFSKSLFDASFTALPMCTFNLLVARHLNDLQKRLYLQATQDSLTGLPNRRWFMDKTPEDIAPLQAVMIIDVDHFKAVNDTLGHDVGDLCLQEMAQHLSRCLGASGRPARIGGEEFAAFLADTDAETIQAIARDISQGFLFDTGDGLERRVTASVGIAMHEDAIPRDQALRMADSAVYRTKEAGRAGFTMSFGPKEPDTDVLVPLAV